MAGFFIHRQANRAFQFPLSINAGIRPVSDPAAVSRLTPSECAVSLRSVFPVLASVAIA